MAILVVDDDRVIQTVIQSFLENAGYSDIIQAESAEEVFEILGMDSGEEPGARVVLSAETGGVTEHWQAEIIRTEGVIDEKSRVTYAVAQVVDPYTVLGLSRQSVLRVGTFVRAEIEGRLAENVVALPRSALGPNQTVLVAGTDDRLEVRAVEVLRAEPQWAFISGGLSGGERVVTTPIEAPVPGTLLAVEQSEAELSNTARIAEGPSGGTTMSSGADQ